MDCELLSLTLRVSSKAWSRPPQRVARLALSQSIAPALTITYPSHPRASATFSTGRYYARRKTKRGFPSEPARSAARAPRKQTHAPLPTPANTVSYLREIATSVWRLERSRAAGAELFVKASRPESGVATRTPDEVFHPSKAIPPSSAGTLSFPASHPGTKFAKRTRDRLNSPAINAEHTRRPPTRGRNEPGNSAGDRHAGGCIGAK
jgi:hypothetical protein